MKGVVLPQLMKTGRGSFGPNEFTVSVKVWLATLFTDCPSSAKIVNCWLPYALLMEVKVTCPVEALMDMVAKPTMDGESEYVTIWFTSSAGTGFGITCTETGGEKFFANTI